MALQACRRPACYSRTAARILSHSTLTLESSRNACNGGVASCYVARSASEVSRPSFSWSNASAISSRTLTSLLGSSLRSSSSGSAIQASLWKEMQPGMSTAITPADTLDRAGEKKIQCLELGTSTARSNGGAHEGNTRQQCAGTQAASKA